MKKLISMILAVVMTLSLFAGCGAAEKKADDNTFTVAIVQQLDHSSLDEIREAIKAQLNALAKPSNYTIEIKEYNG